MEMYTPCYQAFSRYCRGITGNREDARDLAGETILIVFENLDKIKKKNSFKAYLFGVARRLRLNQVRRNKFRSEYNERDAWLLPGDNPAPDLQPDVELLYEYVAKLPSKQKEAFLLFDLSGFTIEEIKKIQGGTSSGVKTRLRRAREQLRLWLNDPEGSRSEVKTKEDKQ